MTVKSFHVLSFVRNFTKLRVIFYIHCYRIPVSSQNSYVELQKIESLIKETPESSLAPSIHEDSEKTASYEPGSRCPPDLNLLAP